jgi:hypothetical protein
MPGNPALRRKLDEAITTEYPEIYRENIERLRREYGHAITILPDGKGRTSRFNCFAYALGVWEHPDFIQKVDDAGHSAILSSTIVQAMIDDGTLKPVTVKRVQPGDVIVYFRGHNVTHAAVLAEAGMCRSKWGGDEVHAHGLWEVPAQYGGRARHFRAPSIEAVLARTPKRART